MNINFPTKNHYFPLRYLPDVVILHVAQFLRPRDLGNMRRVSRHFRQVFSAPHLWKGITICMPGTTRACVKGKIEIQMLETIKLRRIAKLEILNDCGEFDCHIKVILQALPQLEMLSFDCTTTATLRALEQAASSGHLNLTKLCFGTITWKLPLPIKGQSSRRITDLVLKLQRLEEIHCGRVIYPSRSFKLQMGSDLQRALCCSGKLTSVSLFHVRELFRSCLNAIMNKNPQLQTLSLGFVEEFVEDGEMNSTQFSSLTSLDVIACYPWVAEMVLSWAFPGAEPNRSLTSLDVSCCDFPDIAPVLTKLPALRELNLNESSTKEECLAQSFHNLENLERLDLVGWSDLTGEGLYDLSVSVGKTLRHLNLDGATLITDADLRDLAGMFPVLETLDLSGCVEISDASLVEWYGKDDETLWPKLRKLVLEGCDQITLEVISAVRLRTRNQLSIDT